MTEEQKEYKEFVSLTNSTIVGVWDDHDYGANNGGSTL
jgi:hypothetical protein